MLPYQHAASNKISRLLPKCDMKTHHVLVNKTTQGKIGLKTPYCIVYTMWMCEGVCQTSRSLETRCKEHMIHLFLGQPENSTVAKCKMGTGQCEIQQNLQND
jgi:hypothetical protein